MDIITAGRACVRRWYLFIPILAIGILATIHIANQTKPTFEATGSFIVLNSANRPVVPKPTVSRPTPVRGKATPTPTPTHSPTPAPTTTVQNPYQTDQSLLRGALQDLLNGEAFQTQVSKAGYKGDFSVAIAKKQPIFDVTATARHRQNAIDLANGVLKEANTALHTIQLQTGAPANTLLNTQTINSANSASDVTSGKSKRLVAGAVVSVAAAVALAIALDSTVLSLRRRRSPGGLQPAGGEIAQGPSNTTAFLPVDPASVPAEDLGEADGVSPVGKLSHRRPTD